MPNLKNLIYILAGLILFTCFDIASDIYQGTSLLHVLEEIVIVGLSLLVVAILYRSLKRQQLELEQLSSDLENSKNFLQKQSQEMENARKQYSLVIADQFEKWALTGAEKQTAYALLKGLSFKEIAVLREIQEKSVRQQASKVYAKADLEGRHSLSAWFFEDFMH